MASFNHRYQVLTYCCDAFYSSLLVLTSYAHNNISIHFQEMQQYIHGLIPNLAQLRDMPAAFIGTYCRIAARKFFFFCDPQRRGWLLFHYK